MLLDYFEVSGGDSFDLRFCGLCLFWVAIVCCVFGWVDCLDDNSVADLVDCCY